MNLYIFWMHTLVWLIWAQFHQNWMILKIWPLCKRSLTFILFSPLSWQRNIVWISCNWLFYSLWLEEEFEIYFNLIGVFLSFIPIYPLTLDFMVNMVFEKMPGMLIWKFGHSSAFGYMNFQILIKWERVYRGPYTIYVFVYSFFIEGKSTSVTSTAFQAGPHFTENNIYIIIIQYIQYFTIYMIVNLIHGIINRFLLDEKLQNNTH